SRPRIHDFHAHDQPGPGSSKDRDRAETKASDDSNALRDWARRVFEAALFVVEQAKDLIRLPAMDEAHRRVDIAALADHDLTLHFGLSSGSSDECTHARRLDRRPRVRDR